MNAATVETVLPQFLEFAKDAVLVAHNASFDVSFISHNAGLLGIPFAPTVLDTVGLARALLPNLHRYKLDTVAKAVGVSLEHHHRAVDDAEATAGIFLKFAEMLKERHGMASLDDLQELNRVNDETIMKMPTYHVIILHGTFSPARHGRLRQWNYPHSRLLHVPVTLVTHILYRDNLNQTVW